MVNPSQCILSKSCEISRRKHCSVVTLILSYLLSSFLGKSAGLFRNKNENQAWYELVFIQMPHESIKVLRKYLRVFSSNVIRIMIREKTSTGPILFCSPAVEYCKYSWNERTYLSLNYDVLTMGSCPRGVVEEEEIRSSAEYPNRALSETLSSICDLRQDSDFTSTKRVDELSRYLCSTFIR